MKVFRSGMMGWAALAVFASAGLLQGAEHAKFHLPVTAHWGRAVLQPGDYEVLLPVPSLGEINFRIVGAGQTVLELPQVTDVDQNLRSSSLLLTEIDGCYFIRELSFATTGKSFVFAVPHKNHTKQLAKADNTRLPVLMN